MAQKRVDTGRGRKSGVVKSSKSSTSNRAFYLIVAVVAIAGIAALTYQTTRPKATATATAFDTTLPAVKSSGYVLGSESAPVEVTEFGDFECPQCGRFATLTEPDIRSRLVNTGKMRIRYIDYPLAMHRNTWNASRAAACADEQGKFWEMHDAIYANQDRWDGTATGNPDKVLKQIGTQIPGINADSFTSCVDTKKTQAKVQAHYQLAVAAHADGTPTFIFGDQKITAFLSYDEFKKMVDDLTAKTSAAPAAPGGDAAKGVTIPGAKKGP
jgi:protein-disulfide isomerase